MCGDGAGVKRGAERNERNATPPSFPPTRSNGTVTAHPAPASSHYACLHARFHRDMCGRGMGEKGGTGEVVWWVRGPRGGFAGARSGTDRVHDGLSLLPGALVRAHRAGKSVEQHLHG